MSNTAFSIITIVYNDIAHIRATMNSVINQNYKNIEYILIDGGSSDGTREEIHNYIDSCAIITQEYIGECHLYLEAIHKYYPTLTFKFLSEKDNGIYDAMNKGIILATKEWVNFMNCGDRFYSLYVLGEIVRRNLEEYSVVYGDTEIVDKTCSYILHSSHSFKNRMPFCHQSSFVRTSLLSMFLFDTSYKICADNDFFLKLHKLHHKFKKLSFPISSYSLEGISAYPSWRMFFEECKIGYKYNKLFPIYLAFKWLLWTIPKKKIRGLINT